jgi:hypothetical protein
MKTTSKLGLALALSTSLLAACEAGGNKNNADTGLVDSSSSVQSTTDTTFQVDSSKVDTAALADTTVTTAAADTLSKTVTKKTVVKKTVTKKQ